MLCFLGKGENLQKSAKISEILRLGSVCPLRFVPLSAPWLKGSKTSCDVIISGAFWPFAWGVKFPGPSFGLFLAGSLLHQRRLRAENRPQISKQQLLTSVDVLFSAIFPPYVGGFYSPSFKLASNRWLCWQNSQLKKGQGIECPIFLVAEKDCITC